MQALPQGWQFRAPYVFLGSVRNLNTIVKTRLQHQNVFLFVIIVEANFFLRQNAQGAVYVYTSSRQK